MVTPVKQDVVTTGLDLLIDYWEDKPKVQGLLKTQLREMQKIEDVLFQLLTERNITDAIGQQLDVIGYIVGEDRLGREDEPYRQALLLRVAISRADGTAPVILDILSTITGSPVPNIYEHYPASFHAYVDRNASHNLAKVLEKSKVAGVEARLVFDDEGNSYSGAVAVDTEALFFDGFVFEIETGEYFVLEDTEFIGDDNSFLQAEEDTKIYNPFASTIDSTSYYTEVGLFELEDGSLFELEDGSLFEYRILEEIE